MGKLKQIMTGDPKCSVSATTEREINRGSSLSWRFGLKPLWKVRRLNMQVTFFAAGAVAVHSFEKPGITIVGIPAKKVKG